MSREKSRYSVEFSFVSQYTQASVLSPAYLAGVVDRNPSLVKNHIYASCTRPRITIPSGGISITKETIQITFLSQLKNDARAITFERPNPQKIPGLHEVSKWPHTEVMFLDEHGEVHFEALAANLLTSFASEYSYKEVEEVHKYFLDLEVVYIGRSYGLDGRRNAVDRLSNHETLQRIQADVAMKRQDLDIWLVPMAFEAYSIVGGFGTWQGEATEDEEQEHAEDIDNSPLPENQRVALTERGVD